MRGWGHLFPSAPTPLGAEFYGFYDEMCPSPQTAVLAYLAAVAPAVPVQRVVMTLDGRPEIASEEVPGRLVRMTSWLDGRDLLASALDVVVTEAVTRQLATLNTHTRYLADGVVSYAERLIATHTIGPAHAMFTCTGSEAGDLALRIARRHTGGTGVIVTENAYHGVTAALAELSPSLGGGVPLGPHVRTVPAPSLSGGVDFTAAVATAIADLRRHGVRLAAFLADSLLSSDGVIPDPAGFLAPVADLVRAAGGNPVCVAAASAVLDVLESEGLQANSLETGAYLSGAITRLAAGSPVLADVRGAGLYIGADVVSPDTGAPSAGLASAIVNGMRGRRVLISATGPRGHVLKIRPPLPFGRVHADRLLSELSGVLADL